VIFLTYIILKFDVNHLMTVTSLYRVLATIHDLKLTRFLNELSTLLKYKCTIDELTSTANPNFINHEQ